MPRDGASLPSLAFAPLDAVAFDRLVAGQDGEAFLRHHAPHLAGPYSWAAAWDGRPVVAAGLVRVPHLPGYAEAWAVVHDVPRNAWPAITRFARAELARALADGLLLIECTVETARAEHLRWARRLGFEANGVRPGFAGRDCILFGLSALGADSGAQLTFAPAAASRAQRARPEPDAAVRDGGPE